MFLVEKLVPSSNATKHRDTGVFICIWAAIAAQRSNWHHKADKLLAELKAAWMRII
jgi:hypothetical protein